MVRLVYDFSVIEQARMEQGLSDEQLARKSGVNRPLISRWRHEGKVSPRTAKAIAGAVRVPMSRVVQDVRKVAPASIHAGAPSTNDQHTAAAATVHVPAKTKQDRKARVNHRGTESTEKSGGRS